MKDDEKQKRGYCKETTCHHCLNNSIHLLMGEQQDKRLDVT